MNIADLEKVHTTGFEVEDVKVTFKHDTKLKVGGIEIEAKQGEILNIPRWVANILESGDHVEIHETDMVVELKQAIVKENTAGEFNLSTLDPHFYIKLKSYMKKIPPANYDQVESMLKKLTRIRRAKIISLADSSKLTSDLSAKLSIEEAEFYNNLHNISKDFTKQILGDKN